METKKILAPTIIAIATLLVLVVGATYAYFSVTATNDFGTKTIEASAATVGSVALVQANNELAMNLTAADMMDKGTDTAYCIPDSSIAPCEVYQNLVRTTVTGDGTFSCDYTLIIDDNPNSMYDVFQNMTGKSANQIVLAFNSLSVPKKYDFNTANLFPLTINGTMKEVTSSYTGHIDAMLKIVNKTSVDQTALAGTNLTLTINVTDFKCTQTA